LKQILVNHYFSKLYLKYILTILEISFTPTPHLLKTEIIRFVNMTDFIFVCLRWLQWMQLRSRKQNLVRLFEQMQQYQFEQIDPDKPLNASVRTLTEEDIDRFVTHPSSRETQYYM